MNLQKNCSHKVLTVWLSKFCAASMLQVNVIVSSSVSLDDFLFSNTAMIKVHSVSNSKRWVTRQSNHHMNNEILNCFVQLSHTLSWLLASESWYRVKYSLISLVSCPLDVRRLLYITGNFSCPVPMQDFELCLHQDQVTFMPGFPETQGKGKKQKLLSFS